MSACCTVSQVLSKCPLTAYWTVTKHIALIQYKVHVTTSKLVIHPHGFGSTLNDQCSIQ